MTNVINAIFHKLKKNRIKHPVYKDKSDTRRKVVKVRRTLINETLCSEQFLPNFGICYIIAGRS